MIITQPLKTEKDFEELEKGDFVACEFHRNVGHSSRRVRFGVYKIYLNKFHEKEIILEKRDNIYFNYEMYLAGESNCKNIIKISKD